MTFVYFYPHLAPVDVSDGLAESYFWFVVALEGLSDAIDGRPSNLRGIRLAADAGRR